MGFLQGAALGLSRLEACRGSLLRATAFNAKAAVPVASAWLNIGARIPKKQKAKSREEEDFFLENPPDTSVPERFQPINEDGSPLERQELDPIAFEMIDNGWPIKSVVLWDLSKKRPETVKERDDIVKHWESWRGELEARRKQYMLARQREDEAFRKGLTAEERAYFSGETASMDQELQMGFSRTTSITSEAMMKTYGNLWWQSRTSFAHLTRRRINDAAVQRKALLSPFIRPSSKEVLRFSWKNILCPDSDPKDSTIRKVKLMVFVDELHLPRAARDTLVALAGKRYNDDTDELKLVCNNYPTRQQNKEYLLDLLRTLVEEALRPETQQLARQEKEIREMLR